MGIEGKVGSEYLVCFRYERFELLINLAVQIHTHLLLSMEGYSTLSNRITAFEEEVKRKEELKRDRETRMKEELNELHENFEERNNTIISKMEELKRK